MDLALGMILRLLLIDGKEVTDMRLLSKLILSLELVTGYFIPRLRSEIWLVIKLDSESLRMEFLDKISSYSVDELISNIFLLLSSLRSSLESRDDSKQIGASFGLQNKSSSL